MSEIRAPDRNRAILAPPGTRLYAVGDVHGRLDLLNRLLAAILRDAASSRAPRRVIVFLGDYVDRGPDSRRVIETLRQGPPKTPQWSGFRWIALRGNHEESLLRFLDDIEIGPMWLANGGYPTIQDYVGEPTPPPDDLAALQEALRRALPLEHAAFLSALPTWHAEGDYYFVHAGIRPGVPLDRQSPDDLLWIRRPFLVSSADHGKLVVHGHTISPIPEVRPNRIGIDTGAYVTGHLTALVAEGAGCRFLTT
ncbi:MAG TPA: metallophosphoesterase family protein [Patescibacteria group bacterium]|nr:metallophosphoesterase family protein [Patescibacteria group bacterium]